MAKSEIVVENVWNFLDRNPCITRNMSCGLLNVRAPAKYLIKEEKIDAALDAVISAIRRYRIDINNEIFEKARKLILRTTAISTRSPLANISIVKNAEVQNVISQLFSIVNYNLGDVLRIIQGDESINIFVDEKNLDHIKRLIPKEKIIRIYTNLASIDIRIKLDAQRTPGVTAIIVNKLSINNINIIEFMSCIPESLWYVEEKDLVQNKPETNPPIVNTVSIITTELKRLIEGNEVEQSKG